MLEKIKCLSILSQIMQNIVNTYAEVEEKKIAKISCKPISSCLRYFINVRQIDELLRLSRVLYSNQIKILTVD